MRALPVPGAARTLSGRALMTTPWLAVGRTAQVTVSPVGGGTGVGEACREDAAAEGGCELVGHGV